MIDNIIIQTPEWNEMCDRLCRFRRRQMICINRTKWNEYMNFFTELNNFIDECRPSENNNTEQYRTHTLFNIIDEYKQLFIEFQTLKSAVEILKKGIEVKVFNLRNLFSDDILFANSNLILDTVSAEITGEILNAVFKKQLDKLNLHKDGFAPYLMTDRTIDQELSLSQ